MKLCILIQTCDSYEFLWEGLKLSWEENWDRRNFDPEIYVLTENKEFPSQWMKTLSFGMLGEAPSNFSTRLIAALSHLKAEGYESIFYSQDDFWPLFPVKSKVFSEAYKHFLYHELACLHLNELCPWYEYRMRKTSHVVDNHEIWEFVNGSRFYYNHQAAFWNIDKLLEIQAPSEAPYENECRGTERAWLLKPSCQFLNYAWYKPAYVHHKRKMHEVAEDFIRDWKWQQALRNKTILYA
jgi:hypothetical protein